MLTRFGGQDGRTTYYYARRFLNYDPDEFDALAWWKQRLFIEGLDAELNKDENGGSTTNEASRVTFSGRPGEMSRVGFTERSLS